MILAAAFLGFHLTEEPLVVVAAEIHRIATHPAPHGPASFHPGRVPARRKQNLGAHSAAGQSPSWGGCPAAWALWRWWPCALFTAFTGASGVTIVALGALLHPVLIQSGYKERFSLGLINVIRQPGAAVSAIRSPDPVRNHRPADDDVTQVEINDLFLAGIVPGLLMLLMLSAWTLWDNRAVMGNRQPFSAAEAWAAVREAAWEIPLPIFILGGIYGGLIAVSEARGRHRAVCAAGGNAGVPGDTVQKTCRACCAIPWSWSAASC